MLDVEQMDFPPPPELATQAGVCFKLMDFHFTHWKRPSEPKMISYHTNVC